MNVDLSRQDLALILRRFKESEQQDIDEQLLAKKLQEYLPTPDENRMRKYQSDFNYATPLPPLPQET
jgi:hypothetical protein